MKVQLDYTEETKMPFGVHEGVPLAKVPAGYLIWCFGQQWVQDKFSRLYDWIEENMDDIEERKEVEDEEKLYERAHNDGPSPDEEEY